MYFPVRLRAEGNAELRTGRLLGVNKSIARASACTRASFILYKSGAVHFTEARAAERTFRRQLMGRRGRAGEQDDADVR